jgi:uroporphyrinogen-III synthase
VAVTRPADSAEELAAPLRRLGAEVELAPLIAVLPPLDPRPVADAAQTLAQFDWIVFTSANAVRHFAALLPAPVPGGRPPHLRVAVVGPGTEDAVRRELGWSADACPAAYTGAAVAAAMAEIEPLGGTHVLWPRARDAQDILPADLRAAGALLTAPVAYRTEPDPAAARRLIRPPRRSPAGCGDADLAVRGPLSGRGRRRTAPRRRGRHRADDRRRGPRSRHTRVGMGYVGLPLAVELGRAGFPSSDSTSRSASWPA